MNLLDNFPFYKQRDAMDCGATCLKMIAKHYGKSYELPFLREKSFIDREGASLSGLAYAAEHIGFKTMAVKLPFKDLIEEDVYPFIAHWRQRHYVVVYKVNKSHVFVADPAHGKVKMTHNEIYNLMKSNFSYRGCLHKNVSNCSDLIIKAHSISKKGSLEYISVDQHVYGMKFDFNGFNFSIPSNAIVNGIELRLRKMISNPV